jgi:hypothetical protein
MVCGAENLPMFRSHALKSNTTERKVF